MATATAWPDAKTDLMTGIEGLLAKYVPAKPATPATPATPDAKMAQDNASAPSWIKQANAILGERFIEGLAPGQALLNRAGDLVLVPAASTALMNMRGSLLAPIENPLNKALPQFHLGSVLVGGVTGMVLGGVIDGVAAPKNADGSINFMNVALKGGAILALGMWGGNLMGSPSQLVAVGILGIQVLVDVIPQVGQFVNWLVTQIKKVFPSFSASQGHYVQALQSPQVYSTPVPAGLNHMVGAEQRNDLYGGIFG